MRRIEPIERTRKSISYGLHGSLLSNRASRRLFEDQPPTLSPAQREAVEALRQDGIALTTFEALVGDPGLWGELKTSMGEFVEECESRRASAGSGPTHKDDYIIRRRPETKLDAGNPWIRFGASPPVLDVVNAYRGMWSKLVNLEQWYTVPYGSAKRIASQRWHRDPRDNHLVKVFLYFSDVDEGAGPFEYVRGSPKGGPYGDLWPWTLHGEKYPSQEEFGERIPESAVVTATGPAGTIILCDTSGFHRGGYARDKPRILSTHHYVSPAAVAARIERRKFKVGLRSGPQLAEPAVFSLS
jgi:Phytanoyl-CoA dioxygenase (PhyH)